MVRRREVTKFLRLHGFEPVGGTNHEHWTDGVHRTMVPRHGEIDDVLFETIKKQAGIWPPKRRRP